MDDTDPMVLVQLRKRPRSRVVVRESAIFRTFAAACAGETWSDRENDRRSADGGTKDLIAAGGQSKRTISIHHGATRTHPRHPGERTRDSGDDEIEETVVDGELTHASRETGVSNDRRRAHGRVSFNAHTR